MEAAIVTVISTIGVIITTINQKKKKKRKDNIENKLDLIQKEFKKEIISLQENLNKETLGRCKSDLVSLMSKIKNGYTPTTEEKMILYETKEKYNSLGGDSYVDDMFDGLKKEGKI